MNNRKSYLPAALLATSALILALPAGATSPGTTVTLFPNIGPTSVPFVPDPYVSPSYAPYVQNVLGALQTGSPSVGDQSVDPTAFNPIGSPIVNGSGAVQVGLYDIFAIPANTWRGTVPTSGPFAGEFGTWFRPAVHIVSDEPFTTSDVFFHFADRDFQAGGGLRDFYPEASTYAGLDWGADQIKGNADDVAYGIGDLVPAGLSLNELFWTGPAYVFYYFYDPSAAPEDYLADIRAFMPIDYPNGYDFNVSVSLRDTASEVNVHVPVPEASLSIPAALAMASVAAAGVVRRRRQA